MPLGAAWAVRLGLLPALGAAACVARGRGLQLAGLALAAGAGSWMAFPGSSATAIAHEVGVQATATVIETQEGAETVRSLRVNGKVVASTAPVDLRLQRLLGHGARRDPRRGPKRPGDRPGHGHDRRLAPGPAVPRDPGRGRDLRAAVREAARAFGPWNGELLDDPRVTIHLRDGRHYLLADDKRYDLVTSDPIHPWTRGSSDLYALEHFERMAAHLTPDGIASQWLPLYQLSDQDVRTVVATWCAAFPHTAAWLTAYDLALVGWNETPPGYAGWWGRPLPARVATALAEAGVHGTTDLAALQVAGDAELRAFATGADPMVEDRPVLEFRAPRSFLAGYSAEALRWAGRPEYVAQLPAPVQPRATELRAILRRFLERLPQGLSEAARAYGEELLGLGPAGD